MEISDIKQQLTIANVLHYYGYKTDKQSRLNCPFHEDKTPSMQVYYKTQTAYCFSSNCKTHGKSMDVIDFVMHKESCTKHEAIKKAQEILGHQEPNRKERYQPDLSKSQFLANMFLYFRNAVHNSKPAKDYLQQRSLDFTKLEIGYNSGQFHHGSRKDENVIAQALECGLLIDKGITGRTGNKAYSVFGKWCISFALKDKENNVTGLYFRSTLNDKKSKHFYLKDRKGLYPNYPSKNTKKLILTEAIIDAASLLQIETITKEYEVLSCYGTNGLTDEHQNAIKELKQLEEIIFFFDNDTAGKEAVKKYGAMLKADYPKLKLSQAEPINKDINETLQGHEESIFIELLNNRKDIFLSVENPIENKNPERPNASNSIDFLKRKHLLKNLNQLIGKAGIVGEENSRMLLFLIIISYVNKSPLHALVQGSSGSGKTHIISRIADMMPQEDVLRFTRITESSLYNWGEFDLFQKVVIIEDLDGLKEDALYALREFISNQILRSSVTIKDEDIRFTENLIIVQKGKNSKRRLVPISDKIKTELEEFIFSNEHKSKAVFTHSKGQRMQEWTLNKRLKQLILKTKFGKELSAEELNKIGIHNLRHSIATHLLENGMKLEQVQKFLGHSHIESTEIYTHISQNQINNLYDDTS